MSDIQSLQARYAPRSVCHGCGPTNQKGLRLQSYVKGDKVLATWTPQPHHNAFENILAGGIIGNLLDCHMNWTAAYFLMQRLGLDKPSCSVTAYFNTLLKRPTPMDTVHLEAQVREISDKDAIIEAVLMDASGKMTAQGEGRFVAVQPGHPAYHGWD